MLQNWEKINTLQSHTYSPGNPYEDDMAWEAAGNDEAQVEDNTGKDKWQ